MVKEKYFAFEKKLSLYLKNRSVTLLRWSLGIIYLWFGLLKIFDISPMEDLVDNTTHVLLGTTELDVFLGFFETAIGICFFVTRFLRLGIFLILLQMPATFLPFILNTKDCFTHFPLGLSVEGQFILKNFIIVSVALFLISTLHKEPL